MLNIDIGFMSLRFTRYGRECHDISSWLALVDSNVAQVNIIDDYDMQSHWPVTCDPYTLAMKLAVDSHFKMSIGMTTVPHMSNDSWDNIGEDYAGKETNCYI